MLTINPGQFEQPEISTSVNIKNLSFNLNTTNQQKFLKQHTWHFICIASIGCTVMSSTVIIDEENGILKCERDFNFPKSTEDFEIEVRLYAMSLSNKKVRFVI